MSWKPPERNYDRVQYESLRRAVDSQYTALHDELSDCYYNYWRDGKSKIFMFADREWDKLNKAEFDKLHGLIHILQELALDKHNRGLPVEKQDDRCLQQYDTAELSDDRLNPLIDSRDGKILTRRRVRQRKALELSEELRVDLSTFDIDIDPVDRKPVIPISARGL